LRNVHKIRVPRRYQSHPWECTPPDPNSRGTCPVHLLRRSRGWGTVSSTHMQDCEVSILGRVASGG